MGDIAVFRRMKEDWSATTSASRIVGQSWVVAVARACEECEDDRPVVERSEDDCKESSKTNGKAVSQVKPPNVRMGSVARTTEKSPRRRTA